MDKKKKSSIMWSVAAAYLAITVALWFAMKNEKISYEEVSATVVSTATYSSKVKAKDQNENQIN